MYLDSLFYVSVYFDPCLCESHLYFICLRVLYNSSFISFCVNLFIDPTFILYSLCNSMITVYIYKEDNTDLYYVSSSTRFNFNKVRVLITSGRFWNWLWKIWYPSNIGMKGVIWIAIWLYDYIFLVHKMLANSHREICKNTLHNCLHFQNLQLLINTRTLDFFALKFLDLKNCKNLSFSRLLQFFKIKFR